MRANMGARENAISELAEKAIGERIFPGCAIGIIRHSERWTGAFGRHTYEEDSPEVTADTVYDCASITKSIPLATLALQLLAEGELKLSDQLIKYVPKYIGGYRDEITIRHLLTYTIGGLQLSQFKDLSAAEITDIALNFESNHPPGEHFEYSNLPAFLLGLAFERILGPLEKAADERIFKPLKMSATTFFPKSAAPTEIDYRGIVQNIVHDESAYVFRKAGKTVGHAGLFSTVPDLLKFLTEFLEHTMDASQISTNQIPHLGEFTGLGWELNQAHFMGAHHTPHTFGKTGFTGTSIVCDVPHHTTIVILSNRTYPKRPADASAINAFRAAVCDIVFSS